jgi:hypothetical protein
LPVWIGVFGFTEVRTTAGIAVGVVEVAAFVVLAATHRYWDASIRSSDVNEPQINVDHFYHRPIYHVVGLLTDKPEIAAISRDLELAGVDVAAVEILCGERGAAILDEHGRYHGLRGRVVRAFQRLGYDGTTLAMYDEALRDGDMLLRVPVRPAGRRRVVDVLQHHQVHDVGYFGPGTFEQSPSSTGTDRTYPQATARPIAKVENKRPVIGRIGRR